jgi:hypothetical protein
MKPRMINSNSLIVESDRVPIYCTGLGTYD